jgi:hypothetical protein
MKKLLLIFALLWGITAQAQLTFTAPVAYWTGIPSGAPSQKGSRIAADLLTNRLYQWDSTNSIWDLIPYGIDPIGGMSAPSYTPGIGDSPFAINHVTPSPELYYYFSGSWHLVGGTGGGVSWPLLAPNGSAAAPSYSFSGSTGTGIFRDGGLIIKTSDAAIGESVSVRAGATSLDEEYGGGIEITSGAGNGTNSTGGSLVLTSGAAPDGIGGNFVLQSGSGLIGGSFNMQSGAGTQQGGSFTAQAGDGLFGGNFTMRAGNATVEDEQAGSFFIYGGQSSGDNAQGGNVYVNGGDGVSSTAAGGGLYLSGGTSFNYPGPIRIFGGTRYGAGIGGDVTLGGGAGGLGSGKVVIQTTSLRVGVLTTTQRDNLPNKQAGDIIYNTTTATLQLWNGTTWVNL